MPPAIASQTPFQRLAATAHHVAVTGATGWFGRVTLDLLAGALGEQAFRERVTGYASRSREVEVAGIGPMGLRPLTELEPTDVLLHYAFVTTTRVAKADHAAFVHANAAITARVAAAIRTGRVRRFLVTSSGSAHDADLQRNPYGTLKWFDELLYAEACRRTGATCVVARVFNVAGPHMTRPDAYALGDLVRRAQAGRALEIGARGDVVRSYVGVEEVVAVALGELLDDRAGVFETGGAEEVEIEDLARVVRTVLRREELAIERVRDPRAPANVYLGDPARLQELAAHHGVRLRELEELVADTAAALSA